MRRFDSLGFLNDHGLCPDCRSGRIRVSSGEITCQECQAKFPMTQGRPILIAHENKMFPIANFVQEATTDSQSKNRMRRFLPSGSMNLSRDSALTNLASRLMESFPSVEARPPLLVVGSGQQRQDLENWASNAGGFDLVFCDIDTNAEVDLFCDAHCLPFEEGCFAGVITTAVLEHVIDPNAVAEQMARVVAIGGLLYSEIPFMQQVHEGAYDFTRFTLTGHHRLFRQFEVLDSGSVAGPGTALVWAIEYFAMSFAVGSTARSITRLFARLLFFWLKYFDKFLATRAAGLDAASCTFILGRRTSLQATDQEIVASYKGAQRLSHI